MTDDKPRLTLVTGSVPSDNLRPSSLPVELFQAAKKDRELRLVKEELERAMAACKTAMDAVDRSLEGGE